MYYLVLFCVEFIYYCEGERVWKKSSLLRRVVFLS